MTEKVYSYVVVGMVTGEHFLADLNLRIPYRTPIPITDADYVNSRDLNRAVQQNLVKVFAQSSIPDPLPPSYASVAGLEQKVEKLHLALADSERLRKEEAEARRDLEGRIAAQGRTLEDILSAIKSIPAPQTVVVQGGMGGVLPKPSEVVGGDAPMFIPENIPLGDSARISPATREGSSDIGEAARKLRELRKTQGG